MRIFVPPKSIHLSEGDVGLNMKLFDSLLLSIGVALVIMGIYEVMTRGLVFAYAFLMPAIIIFLWFVYRRKSQA